MTENTMIHELYQHTIDMLTEMKNYEQEHYACDLHHYIFNEDMYLIGHHNCREWIKKHNLDVFEMIDRVVQYEQEHFGKSETEITPENVVNMFVYIEGEEILQESDHLQDIWNDECTTEDYEQIIKDLS
jgi:protein-arginine kinase activator protein McsA